VPKAEVMSRLSEAGIDSRPMFDPLSSIPAYAGMREAEAARERNRAAYAVTPSGVNLPSGFNLTEADVVRVVGQFLTIVNTGR
jgi:perosamine synthetase